MSVCKLNLFIVPLSQKENIEDLTFRKYTYKIQETNNNNKIYLILLALAARLLLLLRLSASSPIADWLLCRIVDGWSSC
jgi:hypothetical protein